MKKLISSTLLLGCVSLFGFEYNLKPEKINEKTWCFLGNLEAPTNKNGGFMSNFCYVNTGKSYVLIDSGGTYNIAKESYKIMSKIDNLPVSTVILTHEHDDHWLGASFFKDKFDAKTVGVSLINKNYNKDSKTRMYHLLDKNLMENTSIVSVDKVINEATKLNIDNTEFQIIPVGVKAHSSEDLFVYLPSTKTIFSSDVVMNGRVTSNRDGSVIGQLKALKMIEEFEFNNLIPGHGYDTSKNAIDETKKYFTLLKERILEAVENEVGAANITKVVTMQEFKDKALYDELNSRNVFDAYNELEFYEEE